MGTRSKQDERPILIVTGNVGRGQGPGGWGFVICYPSGQEIEAAGAEPDTTGNRMALTAVVRALERLGPKERSAIRVVSSSQYVVDGALGKAERKANQDLWAELDERAKGKTIAWEWEPEQIMYYQEQAAELAAQAVKRLKG